MACFGALDEFRHTQIPLLLMHELVRWNAQFDWAHKFYHTNNWFAIAARHFFDELTLGPPRSDRPPGARAGDEARSRLRAVFDARATSALHSPVPVFFFWFQVLKALQTYS
jgi:hypothetical protein